MAFTPPPATIHTPTTPLHGPQYDSPPFFSLRKSSRLNKQPDPERTPPPAVADSFDSEAPGELKRTPKSRRSRAHLSPPSSPIESEEMVATTRSAMKKQAETHGRVPQATSTLLSLGLPTPVKTPRKKPVSTASGAAARILFPGQQRGNIEEQLVTPSKRTKRIKKQVGFSLDDEMESANKQIQIYTDSKERVPEVDAHEENPFYVKDNATRVLPKKRKREPEIERQLEKGVQQMDNDRGMVYVFRGRKFYKRFDGPNPATRGGRDGSQSPLQAYTSAANGELSDDLDDLDDADDISTPRRHFTRSSIKPRRLFHSEPEELRQHLGTTTDEEAATDIEDPERHGLPTASSPSKGKPAARKPAPIQSVARSFDAPASPFDSWPRRKSARDTSGTKREGDVLQSGAKRARESSC